MQHQPFIKAHSLVLTLCVFLCYDSYKEVPEKPQTSQQDIHDLLLVE